MIYHQFVKIWTL